jgi:hypothetical protein
MENRDIELRLFVERQNNRWSIHLEASKEVVNGLMPVLYAGLAAAGLYFSAPHMGGTAQPALFPTCPRIEIPASPQGKQ